MPDTEEINAGAINSDWEHSHKDHCFIVMPFGRSSDEERWYKGWYQTVLEPAVRACNYEPILAATEDQPGAINDEIRSHLAFDEMVIVDLGGIKPEDAPNPNVMYELGIRHAFGLPTVILAWEGQRLPFDVSNQRAILTRRDFMDLEPTRQKLVKFMNAAAAGKFYNPMEAVGREAAIERTSLLLGEDSMLAALAKEVKDLRTSISTSRRASRSDWRPKTKVKNAIQKMKKSELWFHAKEIGYDAASWGKLLSKTVEESIYQQMVSWNDDEWIDYLNRNKPEEAASTVAISDLEEDGEIVEAVRLKLPVQPWPTGVHRIIAEDLQLRPTQVSHAIQVLIRRGIVDNQIDGVIINRQDSPAGTG